MNDFDPFRRLVNPAFTTGRPRSYSVDSHIPTDPLLPLRLNHRRLSSSLLKIPVLETIPEDPDFGDDIETLFK